MIIEFSTSKQLETTFFQPVIHLVPQTKN